MSFTINPDMNSSVLYNSPASVYTTTTNSPSLSITNNTGIYDTTTVTSGGGYVYTNSGTASPPLWSDMTTTYPATLQVNGDANIEGDLKLKGKSIKDSLEKIEERLAILHPNEELEEKWENLRGLRKMYMDLEAEIIEKEKMWSILKR